jgi:hypothetical protein
MREALWHILPLIGLAYIDLVNVRFEAAQLNAQLGFSATVDGLGGDLLMGEDRIIRSRFETNNRRHS